MTELNSQIPLSLEIERHKAAMFRNEISRPVRLAIASEIITKETTFFDYGCGFGGDVERMAQADYHSTGWDPYYFADQPLNAADIVNLGYVINVIENPEERRQTIIKAWELTHQVLIVSAQVIINNRSQEQLAYSDGIITRRNTFQKYYEQEELKNYIDEVLEVDSVPVGLGIFFVFRDETQSESFRASRFYSHSTTPKIRTITKRFEDYQEQLTPLINFVSNRGRIPVKGELPEETELINTFGSIRRAFQVILTATNEEDWDAIAYRRSLDIQVYLALSHFTKRPSIRKLTKPMKADIKAFFGSYDEACEVADAMLLSIGQPGVIEKVCKQSKIGKLLPKALYVHISALEELDPRLRLYEGCASRTIGRMDDLTLIKFHIDKPKISYLFYPDFDTIEHPILSNALQIELPNLDFTFRDYSKYKNPPILHRKETFVTSDYPNYQQFAQLTREEVAVGLLQKSSDIGTRNGWEKRLTETGFEIRDHHVYSKQ